MPFSDLRHPLMLAPMAGVTDYAFRTVCRAQGAEYTVSEMISAKALVYEQRSRRARATGSAPLAAIRPGEHHHALQLFGSEPDFMAEAARLLASGEYLGAVAGEKPAAIDINMGCPVPKVAGNGEGSALMRDPARAAAIVRAVADAVRLPVTVKIRSGWDENSINAPEFARAMADAGAAAICIHARTRKQMYAPSADYAVIAAVKRAVDVPVIGNGDIASAADLRRMAEVSGCDGYMIGRGAQGNPWLFAELAAALEGREWTPPTPAERMDTARTHLRLLVEDKGEAVAVREARKHMAWYIHGIPGAAAARAAVMRAERMCEMEEIMEELLGALPPDPHKG
ncbi:MAG: tRNA dihydrouridine synthase DusB [Clostridia bacterium]|nr:tRNA dihydrouridine synthase DusB [Clostridia bacterium]